LKTFDHLRTVRAASRLSSKVRLTEGGAPIGTLTQFDGGGGQDFGSSIFWWQEQSKHCEFSSSNSGRPSGLFTTRLEQSGQKTIGVEFISEDIVVKWCALAFAENGLARIIN
jgi:hypothetical protein